MKTFNFLEAVNSGKRFKPVTHNNNHDYDWITCDKKERRMDWGDITYFSMTDYDFFNSQFELEDKTITITESKFDNICARHNGGLNLTEQVSQIWIDKVKTDIGF